MPVGAIQSRVEIGQPALSQHLARLPKEVAWRCGRKAQKVLDRLTDPEVEGQRISPYEAFCAEG